MLSETIGAEEGRGSHVHQEIVGLSSDSKPTAELIYKVLENF